jgi:dTDP-4-dehydrorhamnose 3,5-epimerase-like enzyme
MVQIPPLVYHGFRTISEEEAIMVNIPTEPYHREDPDEYRLDPHTKKFLMIGAGRTDEKSFTLLLQYELINLK